MSLRIKTYVTVASKNRTLGTLRPFSFIHGFRLLHLMSIRVASLKRIRASSAQKSSPFYYTRIIVNNHFKWLLVVRLDQK